VIVISPSEREPRLRSSVPLWTDGPGFVQAVNSTGAAAGVVDGRFALAMASEHRRRGR
jgi:hypothetical protein